MSIKNQNGLTLVELTITMAIIGILGLTVTPGILTSIPKYKTNNAMKALATELNLCRIRAISKNKVYHAAFDTGNNKIIIYEDADNNWSTANTVVKTISISSDYPNVSLDYNSSTGIDGAAIAQAAKFGATSGPVRATFLPNGLLMNSGEFYLITTSHKGVKNDNMRAVQIGRAGQITIYAYDSTVTPPWREF